MVVSDRLKGAAFAVRNDSRRPFFRSGSYAFGTAFVLRRPLVGQGTIERRTGRSVAVAYMLFIGSALQTGIGIFQKSHFGGGYEDARIG